MISILFVALAAVQPEITPATQAAAEAPAPPATRARAIRNLAAYIHASDYRDQNGRVQFELTVSPRGRATDCRVVTSSGSTMLDDWTCEIMVRRARFRPARDAAGNPVADAVRAWIGWESAG